ncbi:4-hydroxythreonine-4-phosphate dehydrogenase PdxA [Sphingomonas sp. MG17]|uniref:4-hydroxythreonine-4-phosphate dehydrogenase PdxA n=1 Tax=Sphingomonas tagetis TaxID=2949092 RepID=A0A9X2HJ41_9SPHN|nr:4-hydroxythreonine-4-phosphate dehydrogenase PdxA [Sphingomonas tagetis]
MSEPAAILLAIGDPNGIGPEIAVKAALSGEAGLPRLLLVGDDHVIGHYCGDAPRRMVDAANPPPPEPGLIDIVPAGGISEEDFAPGQCNAASGRATVAYVEAAFAAARSGPANAIVACPHNETAVNAAGIAFTGYPSLIARIAGKTEDDVFLMLVGGGLRIVHATLHERLSTALARIDSNLVIAAGVAAHAAARSLGIEQPRIGIFGINPHAGENGLFGNDDDLVTVPAANALHAMGIDVAGPAGADLLLSEGKCDVYLAMFHDQGHIPIKLLAGRRSAAFSIGGDALFASVGHGSAPDIAGQGRADAKPLISTLKLIASATAPHSKVVAA